MLSKVSTFFTEEKKDVRFGQWTAVEVCVCVCVCVCLTAAILPLDRSAEQTSVPDSQATGIFGQSV